MTKLITAFTFTTLAFSGAFAAGNATSTDVTRYSGKGHYSAQESASAVAAILVAIVPVFDVSPSKPVVTVDININKKNPLMTMALDLPTGVRNLKCEMFTATSESATMYHPDRGPEKVKTSSFRGMCLEQGSKGEGYDVVVTSNPNSFYVILTDVRNEAANVEIIQGDASLKVN